MPGTRLTTAVPAAIPPHLAFRNDVFMVATAVLLGGKANDAQRAQAVGISRNTLNRLRAGNIEISLRRALMMANQLGMSVSDLFEVLESDTTIAA